MAEIGLAVSIISFVNQGIAIAQQLKGYSSTATDVPRSLVHIQSQLPLLLDALKRSASSIQAGHIGEGSHQILEDVLKQCKGQVVKLEVIVKKMLPVEGDSPFVRTQKAVAAMRSEGKLAIIKGNLQSYIALVTCTMLFLVQRSWARPKPKR